MDPYLEARWSNVHVLMVSAIAALLKPALPAGLEARPEEEICIETIAGERLRGFGPDVAVVDSGRRDASLRRSEGGMATALVEPIRIQFHRGPVVLRNIEVIDTRDNDRIVTIIEVLSPWNKLPGQLNRYNVAKLKAIEEGETNWVEIDLLRSSRSHLLVTWDDLPDDKRTHYLAVTFNADQLDVLAYPISMLQRLPRIPIPLRKNDASVLLDLQAALDRVLSDGPFDSMDYSAPPDPPLAAADAAWIAARLVAAPKTS